MTYLSLRSTPGSSRKRLLVDLAQHLDQPEQFVFGYTRGRRLRRRLDLDAVDRLDEVVTIRFPSNVCLVTDIFLLGLLGQSMRTLGIAAFKDRFTIEGPNTPGPYHIASVLQRVMDVAAARWNLAPNSLEQD